MIEDIVFCFEVFNGLFGFYIKDFLVNIGYEGMLYVLCFEFIIYGYLG